MFMVQNKAAMKSWRFPETRQGRNMLVVNIYDHQGSTKRKGTIAGLCMVEFYLRNHVYGKTTEVVLHSKKGK